jgi:hypothetical protein
MFYTNLILLIIVALLLFICLSLVSADTNILSILARLEALMRKPRNDLSAIEKHLEAISIKLLEIDKEIKATNWHLDLVNQKLWPQPKVHYFLLPQKKKNAWPFPDGDRFPGTRV